MKLNTLRYFAAVAEELHYGRAAARLSITQPPLSAAIKALEGELGVQLLERDSKHVRLTAAGSAFRAEVNEILQRVARAADTAQAVAGGLIGRLDIGVTGSLFYREVPEIVARFNLAMPGIEVTLREMASGEQVHSLLHGQIDGGFINAAVVPPQLASVAMKDDRFVCCLPDTHIHASASSLRLSEIADETFVMFSRDVAPANHDNVIAIFSRARIHPKTCHAARQWLTVIAMVANGLGIALVPVSLARSEVAGVRFVPLNDRRATSPAVFAWNPGYLSSSLEGFIRCTTDVISA